MEREENSRETRNLSKRFWDQREKSLLLSKRKKETGQQSKREERKKNKKDLGKSRVARGEEIIEKKKGNSWMIEEGKIHGQRQ